MKTMWIGIIVVIFGCSNEPNIELVHQQESLGLKVGPSDYGKSKPKTRVLLVIWDGCQRNHLEELLYSGELPHLKELIDQGGLYRHMEIRTTNCGCTDDGDNYHTETGPAHAAMFTGYGFPNQANHGNSAKREYWEKSCPSVCPKGSPESCYTQLGPQEIPEGYTFFERLRNARPQVRQAVITSKDLMFFPFPAFAHVFQPEVCAGAFEICGDGNVLENSFVTSDIGDRTIYRALSVLEKMWHDSFFLVVHFHSPDEQGHAKGENSIEYTDSIINDDFNLGRLVGRLKESEIYEKTTILITTDHGFVEGGTQHHSCVPETKSVWIASNNPKAIGNMSVEAWQTSIAPTLFDVFGMDKNVKLKFESESLYLGE